MSVLNCFVLNLLTEDLFVDQPMEMSVKEPESQFHKLMSLIHQAKPQVDSVRTVLEQTCLDANTLSAVKEMWRLDEILDKSHADESVCIQME